MSTPDTKTMNDQFHALCLDLIREWDSAPTSSDFIDTGGNGVIDRIREALLQSQAAVADSGKEKQCEKSLTCHLTYFKKRGKFYDEAKFPVDSSMQLFKIWEMVEDMRNRGRLPGLVDGAKEFVILVNVPGHRHEHPRLIQLPD
jgi:hypothetical protein